MKKLFASLAAAVAYGFPAVASAQLTANLENFGLNEFRSQTNLGTNLELIATIASIINILLGFLGVLAVLLILYAGFLWMTAAGNEENIGKAKQIMSAGVIGLVIILAAFALASFIVTQLADSTGFRNR